MSVALFITMKKNFKEAVKSAKELNFPILLRNACPIILTTMNIVAGDGWLSREMGD
jgi:hypothetical protein